jgi:flagellar hook-associated protein FlgK
VSSFDIGVSALYASQRSLDIIGQNVANSNTPGYHRQVATLAAREPVLLGNLQIGTGVEVTDVQQLRSQLVESAVTAHTSELGDATAQTNALDQLQTLLGQGDGSVQSDLEQFFNDLEQLGAQPQDVTQRRVALTDAGTLADQFNSLANDLATAQNSLDSQIQDLVNDVNSKAQQIAELNGEIQNAQVRGVSPNDLLDRRDQLVNDIADSVGLQVVQQPLGQVSVIAAGVPVVVGPQSTQLRFAVDGQDQAYLAVSGSNRPLQVSGGQLAGLLAVRNGDLQSYRTRLNDLAGQLARSVDNVQATGLGLTGPATLLTSQRAVRNTAAPLAQAGLAFPPQAGDLYVSVTDQATGARTLTKITIDPSTQSLQDVANALSAIPNLQAVADAQTGTLQVLAKPGFAFDFAGRPDPSPSAAGITGTTRPTAGGTYTGPANNVYTYTVVGSGTVGVTAGLALQVKDSGGATVATLNIGQGYAPGTDLTVANGVTVQLSAGTANAGDSFSTDVVAQPDTAGLLTALGLGTFFTGSTAADLAVSPALAADPSLLAGSRDGQPGDSSNLQRLVALRDVKSLAGGTQTFSGAYAAMVGNVGTRARDEGNRQSSAQSLGQALDAQRQSVSGVDPNEELVNMLTFQRSFQMASQYISVVNTTLDSLLTIIQ